MSKLSNWMFSEMAFDVAGTPRGSIWLPLKGSCGGQVYDLSALARTNNEPMWGPVLETNRSNSYFINICSQEQSNQSCLAPNLSSHSHSLSCQALSCVTPFGSFKS